MIYFPFVEMIKQIIAWAKRTGSPVYWSWVALICIPCVISGWALSYEASNILKIALAVGLGIWVIGWYPVMLYEKHHHKKGNNE